MENGLLIKTCTITIILGIILLIIIIDKIDLPTSTIGKISKSDLDKTIKIRGFVKTATNRDTVSFLEVEDKTGKIKITAFKPENLKIKKGSMVEIEGKVSLYEENLEIYAQTIKIVN